MAVRRASSGAAGDLGPYPLRAAAGDDGPSGPGAGVSVRIGRSAGVRRFRRRLIVGWALVALVDALVGWSGAAAGGFIGVFVAFAAVLFGVTVTAACLLAALVLFRGAVAAGPGWVRFRVLHRWRTIGWGVASPRSEPGSAEVVDAEIVEEPPAP